MPFITLIVFVLLAFALTCSGRQIALWMRLPAGATTLEKDLIGFGLGLGLLAYGILLLGLCGGLATSSVIGLSLFIVPLGGRQFGLTLREIGSGLRCVGKLSPIGYGIAALFLAFAVVALIGDWTPPTLMEWDSLSYHLADPKLYVEAHRIYYLPWESHSNFAFTAEMWYTFGLLCGSVPLAKLFHFSCAVGTCLAVYAFAARHLTPRVGVWAALLFASTPLVFWEAGTAYADLAATLYGTLTLLALANGLAEKSGTWLRLSAVLMGLTLSTKATALTTLALFALALLFWRLRGEKISAGKAVGQVALWCVLALVIGAPWYVKSFAYTGNPVYPFYSQLFGGRYWNAALAAAYDASNHEFGMGHRPVDALLAPWDLTLYLLPGHPTTFPHPFNNFQSAAETLTPLLLAALFFPAFGLRPAPPAVKALGVYALASLLLWFATMQYARYMLPLLPVLCLLAAWVMHRALTVRAVSGYALAGLFALSLLFSLYVGIAQAAAQAPVALGQVPRDTYIAARYPGYRAEQYLNGLLGPVKVVFYGHPFGFYCDKPYFWGDPGHSTYIPYDQIHSPEDLRRALLSKGVTHLLIDQANFPPSPGVAAEVYALAAQCGPPLTDGHVLLYRLNGGG